MKPNDGRESAYVRSRVTDKSNVLASTEYLPLFTCLAPKGDSIEPVLIRDVYSLIEEFGDPTINPILYRDLITIRDFVKGGRSCWVNRVPVDAKKFHYYYYINNTIPMVYTLYFSYPKWNTLTSEERKLVNAGYLNGGSSVVRFSDHLGNVLDVDIYTDIIDVLSKKDEIYEKTGWVIEVPDNPLVNIAKKHNSLQQYTSSTNGGKKYITMRWLGSYSTPENHKFTSTPYYQPLDSNNKIIRNAAAGNRLYYPTELPQHFKMNIVPVKVLEDVIDAYIGDLFNQPIDIEPNTTKFIYNKTNTIVFKSRTIQVSKPDPEQETLYIEPSAGSTTATTIGKNEADWKYLHTVSGDTSTGTLVTNFSYVIIDEYYKDKLEFVSSSSKLMVKVKDDYPEDTITVVNNLSIQVLKHGYISATGVFYYPEPDNPSSKYITIDSASYTADFPDIPVEDGLTISFSVRSYYADNSLVVNCSRKCMWYYEGPMEISVPDIPVYELMKIHSEPSKQYSILNTDEAFSKLTFLSNTYFAVRNTTDETVTLQNNAIKIGVANEEGTGDVYQKVLFEEGTYYTSGTRYISDKLMYVFYKALRYTASKLRNRRVYSDIPIEESDWDDFLVKESALEDGVTYYTNEKDYTSIERTDPNWQIFTYTASSPNIPKADLFRLYYTNTSPSPYWYNTAFEICDENYNLNFSTGGDLTYVDDLIISRKIQRTLYEGLESRDFSVYLSDGLWTYVGPYLEDNYGIVIHYPDGYSAEKTHLTSMDINLITNIDSLTLFNIDSVLFQYSDFLTITSVTKLKPSSAGIKIHYVMQGYDISFTNILIDETITLQDQFTDGQFAEAMNANPYITLNVEDPDSKNIYKAVIGGYTNNLEYTYIFDLEWSVTLEDYQKSIKQYADPKYYGNFIADLTYPLVRYVVDPDPYGYDYYETYVMPEDDRRAVHWTMKEIASTRKDLICIFSTPNLPLDQACNWVAAKGDYSGYWEYGNTQTVEYAEQAFYCEMYYGWFSYKTTLLSGQPYKIKEVNSTLFVIANIIDAWNNKGISFPVAGDQGGILNSNINYISILDNPDTKQKKDKLVSYRINPIWDTGTRGIQIYGNETLNPQYTDLSAAHIARLLVQIRNQIDTFTETVKFSLNNKYTWGSWINSVSTKILDPLKAQGGLVWYNVQMGTETTTPQEIANRRINGKVSLQFRPDLEIIDLEYTVYSSALDMVEVSSNINFKS